jgi:hypothetical protein
LSAAVFDDVLAVGIRGDRLEFHRLGADYAGYKEYQRALVIVHGASNSNRNRSFRPRNKAAELPDGFELGLKVKGKVMQNLLLGFGIGLVGTLVVLTARYVAALLAS